MTIYYLLIIFIGICSFFTLGNKNIEKRNKIIVVLSCLAIILIQGLRSIYVGIDVPGYIKSLHYIKNMNFFAGEKLFNYEIGYSLYCQLFSKLNIPDQLYLFIVAATIIIPIGYIISKYSKMPGLSLFVYVTLGFFTFSFSALRQSIAMAIVVFGFKYIQKEHLMKFLVCVLIATSFHTSAIIFILAYPLYYLKLKPHHWIFIIPSFMMMFFFRTKIFGLIYYIYTSRSDYIEGEYVYGSLVFMIVVLILTYIFGDNKNMNLNAYKNYMLMAILIQVFANESNIIMRAGFYYYIFIILLLPEVISYQRDTLIRVLTISILGLVLLYYFRGMGGGYLNVSPYYFYWE